MDKPSSKGEQMRYNNSEFNVRFDLSFIFACFFSLLLFFITVLPARGENNGAKEVNAGERAKIHITCKEPDGKIILTTYRKVDEDALIKKSDIYTKPYFHSRRSKRYFH